ncbi:uncharacterized protein PHALS_11723 [Plasmopara halstedii]|uniref:Uncharacterized protein n=1 Tax=Plasmopara halstedii TaxID=4781 RepID=A0A0P1AJF2_PLAHL|nr:uncharacterized protein PHALS_11723 [Plasmopara halstedii]CEG41373.1 hypothetical protein PHALS_11723 [Plasmopara halstedii]|eukprot:XP_024577742.1 hypothetical protein PHALS_11723 [Plasmopara halstedii]
MTYRAVASEQFFHLEKRVNSPRSHCNSPSSISDVDLGRGSTSKAMPVSSKPDSTDAVQGDKVESQDARKIKKVKAEKQQLTPAEADSDYLPTDIDEDEEDNLLEYSESSLNRDRVADGCSAGYVAMDSAANFECDSELPRSHSRRTLYIEYWSRTDECKERKWDHLDDIAENFGSAEEHIFATTLKGIEHWTLWHIKDLNHELVKQYVESWIDANAPHVERWNYDDNPERSIDIFHVHVYFQVAKGRTVLLDRKGEAMRWSSPSSLFIQMRTSCRAR